MKAFMETMKRFLHNLNPFATFAYLDEGARWLYSYRNCVSDERIAPEYGADLRLTSVERWLRIYAGRRVITFKWYLFK